LSKENAIEDNNPGNEKFKMAKKIETKKIIKTCAKL